MENKEKSKISKGKNISLLKCTKLLTIVLAIVLVAMVSFVGIFKIDKNKMVSKVKEYTYGMDINGSRNIKLTIEYDGKDFNGWQKQPNKLNIQGEIEQAIKEITGEEIDLIGSRKNRWGCTCTAGKLQILKQIAIYQ